MAKKAKGSKSKQVSRDESSRAKPGDPHESRPRSTRKATRGKPPEQPAENPAEAGKSRDDVFPIVAIGASAGGLAALKTFFAHVPADSGLAYVVVVHLAPEHKSHLAELLQPFVRMPVQQVTETVKIERNRVYVIPPNANLDTIDTHLRLSELEERRQERAPIDHFFRTLAKTHDGQAIGVILTGTGSDGTLGLREIKQRGGPCLVQDPAEAEYDGMPQSAVATGVVDLVLELAEIPAAIFRIVGTRPRVPEVRDGEEPEGEARRVLHKVFSQLRARTGRDYSRYKRSTIFRRIQRRMQLRQVEELDDYLELIRNEPEEARILGDDLLITVTSFFRDQEVFDVLQRDIVPRLFAGKNSGDELRIWSVGCATGEEAYSLAMLLSEEAARHEHPPHIQVFASDLHEHSLIKAREGFYPGDIETDVAPERLRRFFVKENGGYRVRKELREIVVFAPHNLLADPPFSRIDLISCRNLLIYIERAVQRDIVEIFHYALRPEGILLLGTSETIDSGELFHTEDKKHCIYRKRNVPGPEPRLPVFPLTHSRLTTEPRPHTESGDPVDYGKLHRTMLERYAPGSALISPDDKVVHLSEHVGRYLLNPAGEPTLNIFKLVRKELQLELRAALHTARTKEEPADTKPLHVKFNGDSGYVTLHVRPATDAQQRGFALVIFNEYPESLSAIVPTRAGSGGKKDAKRGSRAAQDKELEAELEQMRQRLQAIVEEYETSQEEMKASNEEMQSTNEELRSTMEELETSKEELQSVNEELQTVNQENRHKVEELSQLSSDLQNLLSATGIATLFLDRQLRIMRFTPKVGELFNIRLTDRGRPISDLTHRLGYDDLHDDARRVLESLIPIDREVDDESGRCYLTRVMPYRTAEHRIDGVVITFVDITTRKQAERELAEAKEFAESIVETLHEPLLVLKPDLRVKSCNPAFYQHFQVARSETEGRKIYELGNGQWNIPQLRDLLENVLPKNNVFSDYEVRHKFEDLGERIMLLNGRRLDHVQLILLGIRDISERKRAEEAIKASEQRLQRLINIRGVGVLIFRRDGTLIDANDSMLEMIGYNRDEVRTGRITWRTMTPPEWVEASEQQLRQMEETGCIGTYEKEYMHKDGSRSWMLFAGADMGDGTIVEYCIDVGDRKGAETKIRQQEQRFRTLVEQIQDYAIFMLDVEGRPSTWNEGVKRVLGYDEQQFVGQNVADLIYTPEDIAAGIAQAELEEASATGSASNDRWMRRIDGTRFWASGITTALRDEAGGLLGYMKVMRDHTDRKLLEDELRTMAGDLSEANRRKDEFLATLAHEIRNPLAPIRTGLELMKLSAGSMADFESVRHTMERQTEQLVRLIDDLLDVSRITRGRLELRKRRTLLQDVIRSAVEASRPVIDEAGHELVLELPPQPVTVEADPHRLAQVLSNLLSNSAKYTPAGGKIWLTAERSDGDAVIAVRDTGIGIPVEMRDRVFEIFTQLGSRGSDAGLGIGLTLVKSLVELHGGHTEIDSPGIGQGTVVTIRLPVVVDEELDEPSPELSPAIDLSGLRILVVDDSRAAADMLGSSLKAQGCEIRVAYDGQAAVDAAAESPPDAIIMDIGMPRLNGYEAARLIRRESWGKSITLIAVTGWGQEADKRRAKEAGFDHHLVKPPEPNTLRRLLVELKSDAKKPKPN